jgi:hypothetical protein
VLVGTETLVDPLEGKAEAIGSMSARYWRRWLSNDRLCDNVGRSFHSRSRSRSLTRGLLLFLLLLLLLLGARGCSLRLAPENALQDIPFSLTSIFVWEVEGLY